MMRFSSIILPLNTEVFSKEVACLVVKLMLVFLATPY